MSLPRYSYPLAMATLLAILTTLWVPVNTQLIEGGYYYADLLQGLRLRALTGTFGAALHVSPAGFIALVQSFKIAWLCLLCLAIFKRIDNRMVASALCILFGFSYAIFSDNALAGFVDMPGNFWLLLAACLILKPQDSPAPAHIKTRLCLAACALLCAFLTHEKTLFPAAVLLAWAALRYGRLSVLLILPYALAAWLCCAAAWLTDPVYGWPTPMYLDVLTHNPLAYFSYFSANITSMFYGIGMLWFVYAALGILAVRSQPNAWRKTICSLFLLAAALVNFIPLFFAADTPRMLNTMWLAVFILLIDQSALLNRNTPTCGQQLAWAACCLLHLLIPPLYMYSKGGSTPINCYSVRIFPYIQGASYYKRSTFFLWDSHRDDVRGNLQCWPPVFLRGSARRIYLEDGIHKIMFPPE